MNVKILAVQQYLSLCAGVIGWLFLQERVNLQACCQYCFYQLLVESGKASAKIGMGGFLSCFVVCKQGDWRNSTL